MTSARPDWHIIPLNDLRPHEPEMTCWCRPETNEDNVAVHHSMDGREDFQSGARKPS
jgi:hypothetical protein